MYIKGMYVPGIVEESEEGTNAKDHTWERGKILILFWQLRSQIWNSITQGILSILSSFNMSF